MKTDEEANLPLYENSFPGNSPISKDCLIRFWHNNVCPSFYKKE